ncbi:MAG: hypothetical protein IPO37_23665 [Saprospiraceae bacterium]|nr:hypothetical protein [Saprospiraceae bacterium]
MKSIRYDQHYKYQHILVLCYEQLSGIIDGKSHHINYQHLVMLLSGISLVGLHQRPRYEMKKTG